MARELRSDAEIAWGWTVTDVEHIAASAATRHGQYTSWLPWEHRRTCARDGILDHLYDAAVRPETRELVNAGHAAINAEVRAIQRNYGVFTSEGATGGRYSTLWIGSLRCYAASFMDDWADRQAIRQVWDQMREYDREPIRALIEAGDYAAAAAAMRIPMKRYQSRLGRARHRARVLFFWPEIPPRQWARDYAGRASERSVLASLRQKHAKRRKAAAND